MEISIQAILARHPTPGLREANIRHTVAEAITELTTIPVKPSQVRHVEGKLVLNVPPVLKSAVLLRMDELKSRLKEGGLEIVEIR